MPSQRTNAPGPHQVVRPEIAPGHPAPDLCQGVWAGPGGFCLIALPARLTRCHLFRAGRVGCPKEVSVTHMVAIRATEHLWQEALASAVTAPLYAVVPILVEVASSEEATARIGVERIEPRSMWQMALGIYAALRAHGLDAHIELAKVGSSDPSVPPLRLELALTGPPDPGALMLLLETCLAPVRAPEPSPLEPAPVLPEGPIIRVRETPQPDGVPDLEAAWTSAERAPAKLVTPEPRTTPSTRPDADPVISLRADPVRPEPAWVPPPTPSTQSRPDPMTALPRGRMVRVRPRSAQPRLGDARVQSHGTATSAPSGPAATLPKADTPTPMPGPEPSSVPRTQPDVVTSAATVDPPSDAGPGLPPDTPFARASAPEPPRGPWGPPAGKPGPGSQDAPRTFARPVPGKRLAPPPVPGATTASDAKPGRPAVAQGDAPPGLPWPSGFPVGTGRAVSGPPRAAKVGPPRPMETGPRRPATSHPPRIWENRKTAPGQVVTGWDFRTKPQGQPIVRRRG